MITGERSYGSLFGVTAHELAHAWFQHSLGKQ
jgi:aminopeptidase N